MSTLARPDFTHEKAFGAEAGRLIVGLDEVGRGPWAGPVAAAAVRLDPDRVAAGAYRDLRDSKAMTAKAREDLAARILAEASVGIGEATVAEIDQLNILQASFLAMRRALAALPFAADHALVDGKLLPDLGCPATAVVKGDALCLSIAAAAVVAKVHRDAAMTALDGAFPGYAWAANKGYGTAAHRAGLARLGPCPEHRRSFKPIAAFFTASS